MSTIERGRRQIAKEDRETAASVSAIFRIGEMETVEPIYGRTEHGDVIEIPAGTVIRLAELAK